MTLGARMSRRRRTPAILVAAAVATALVGCADESSTEVADSVPSPSPDVSDTSRAESERQPDGFTTVQAMITDSDGEMCEVCLWLADDAGERGRGLMGVTDLGEAVGMAFVFEGPTSGSFYMFQTPSPLSIAWFSPSGVHVGSADMDPCLDTPAGECPLYSPEAEYELAIEVFEGGLEALGLVAGSRVELIEGSEAELCPVAS